MSHISWFLSFCSNGRVQVCDSLRSGLTRSSRKSIRSLYKHYVADDGEQIVTFLPLQKQPDGHNCGPFAIAYAAEILDEHSPSERSPPYLPVSKSKNLIRFLKFPINRYILTLFTTKFVLIF